MKKRLYQKKLPKDDSLYHSREAVIGFLESLNGEEWLDFMEDLAIESILLDSVFGYPGKDGFPTLSNMMQFFREMNKDSLENLREAVEGLVIKGLRDENDRILKYRNLIYVVRALELRVNIFLLRDVSKMFHEVDVKTRRSFKKYAVLMAS